MVDLLPLLNGAPCIAFAIFIPTSFIILFLDIWLHLLSFSVAEPPSLPNLLNFSTFKGDTIDITHEVGSKYENFGIHLLNDMSGEIVDEISEKYSTSEKIVKEILKHWIRGKGEKPRPVSWETLIDALKASGLTDLASCIYKSL